MVYQHFQVNSISLSSRKRPHFPGAGSLQTRLWWHLPWDAHLDTCMHIPHRGEMRAPPLGSQGYLGRHQSDFWKCTKLLISLSASTNYDLQYRHKLLFHLCISKPNNSAMQVCITYTEWMNNCMCVHVLSCFNRVQLFVTLWTIAHQAPLSMGFSRQECWSGLLCPPWIVHTVCEISDEFWGSHTLI